VGDWAAALNTARLQQVRQDLLNVSSTCSTGSPYSPASPPAAAASDSCCYTNVIGPEPGVAVQLAAAYPSSSLGLGSWSLGSPDVSAAACVVGSAVSAADAALTTVECAGGVLMSKVQLQEEFAARRCSSAYLGAAVAAPAGEWS
jgi:hypothetical protein